MDFKMRCPKCGSQSYSIERYNRSYYVQRTGAVELVFSCRCGKQLFGDQIEKEYERQKKEWTSASEDRRREEEEREAARLAEEERQRQLREAMAFRRRYLEEQRQAEADRRREEELRRHRAWQERVAKAENELPPPPLPEPEAAKPARRKTAPVATTRPRAAMSGRTRALVRRCGPNTLTSNRVLRSSSSNVARPPMSPTPALLTRP